MNLTTCLSLIKIFENQNKISWQNSYRFLQQKIPKLDSNHTCLALISLDSALMKYENYYLQVFLKECKYIEKKIVRHDSDNLSDFFSSDDESDEE